MNTTQVSQLSQLANTLEKEIISLKKTGNSFKVIQLSLYLIEINETINKYKLKR